MKNNIEHMCLAITLAIKKEHRPRFGKEGSELEMPSRERGPAYSEKTKEWLKTGPT